MTLVKDYAIGINFWEANPQLIHMPPFSALYKRDKSKGKTASSDEMWAVFFYSENSSRSVFYRLDEEKRKDILEKEFSMKFDEACMECCLQYPVLCMSAIERSLKQYEDWLVKRTNAITSQKYEFDYVDEDGIFHKGNIEQLDKAAAQSKRIWDDYLVIKKQFDEEEKGKGRLRGNRKLSAGEQGIL